MMGALASLPARRRALAAARARSAREPSPPRAARASSPATPPTDDDAARYDPTACPCYYTENYFPKTVRSAGAEATNALPTDPLARRASPRSSRVRPSRLLPPPPVIRTPTRSAPSSAPPRSLSPPILPSPPSTNPNSHSVVQLRRHVSYPGTPSSFDASHPELVASLPPETLAVVHAELAAELRRRRREPAESARRRRKIAAAYKRLRPDAYRLDVDERLAALARIAREVVRADPATAREKLLERAAAIGADGGGGPTIRQRPAGVFSFPAFPARFRDALREEIAHFEASLPAIGVPVARPNTMNENGVLLAEIPGMCEGVVDPLVREYVAPLSAALYGDEYSYGGGGGGGKKRL